MRKCVWMHEGAWGLLDTCTFIECLQLNRAVQHSAPIGGVDVGFDEVNRGKIAVDVCQAAIVVRADRDEEAVGKYA